MKDALQHALDVLSGFLAENPLVGAWYTTVVRFVFPLLALMILVGAIRSLWKVKHPDEVWGYLTLGNGVRLPLTHWENIIGRAAACDVQLEYPSVSRQHAALIRENDGSWTVYDLNSKGGIKVNENMEVLDTQLDKIPGLYSCGTDCATVFGDSYCFYNPGSTMSYAINSGRIAAIEAVKYMNSEGFVE